MLTGSRAAAAGGFTAVLAMANTSPVTDTAEAAERVLDLGRAAGLVDVQPVGAVTRGLGGEELAELGLMARSRARVRVFSDDGRCVSDARVMRRALEYVKASGGVISQHSQDPDLAGGGACCHEGELSGRLGLPGWPGVAEEVVVARDVVLARHTGSRVHVAHVSTAGSVEVLRWAKARGLPVTAEVTPHHLLLTTDLLSGYDPTFKVNPPLRPDEDVAALREALADGTIDAVATDHAPHARHDKEHAFVDAAFGMLGLETALPVVATVMVETGAMAWADVARVMSTTPARIAGLEDHGRPLEAGEPANVTLVDPTARRTVDRDASASLSRNNPWHGRGSPPRSSPPGCAGWPPCSTARWSADAGVAPGPGARAGADAAPDVVRRLLAAPPDLPVVAGLGAVRAALASGGAAVVQAPPGSGKTTLVPPLVADLVGQGGRVVVTQPRRIAARAAAAPAGRPAGRAGGPHRRLRRARRPPHRGPATRVEVVTTGVLLRRLQRDPELPGVGAVVLDEVHERPSTPTWCSRCCSTCVARCARTCCWSRCRPPSQAERLAQLLGGPATSRVAGPRPSSTCRGRCTPSSGCGPRRRAGCAAATTRGDAGASSTTWRRPSAGRWPSATATCWSSCPARREVDGVVRGAWPAAAPTCCRCTAASTSPRRTAALTRRAAAAGRGLDRGGGVVADRRRRARRRRRRAVARAADRPPARAGAAWSPCGVSRAAADQRAGRAGREGPGRVTAAGARPSTPHLAPASPAGDRGRRPDGFALDARRVGQPPARDLALPDPPPAGGPGGRAAHARRPRRHGRRRAVTARGRAMAAVPPTPGSRGPCSTERPRSGRDAPRRSSRCSTRASGPPAATSSPRCARCPRGRRAGGRALAARAAGWAPAARPAAAPRRVRCPTPPAAPRRRADSVADDVAVGAVVALAHPDRVARPRRRPVA